MAINDKIKSLYDTLKADGADVGSEQEFNDWFLAKGDEGYKNRKSVYDAFKADGADVGKTYEEFRDWLGLHPQTQTRTVDATPKVASQEYMGWQKAAKEARDKLFSGPAANGGKIPNYFQDVAPIQERAELADRERKAVRNEYDKENFEGFYQANVKPVFEAEKTAGEKRASANDAFNNMALRAAGYDRETSLAVAARQAVDVERETDPAKIAQNTVKAVEQGKVDDYVLGRMGFDGSATTDGQESAPLSDEEKLLFYQLYGKEVSEVTDMMVQRMYREYQAAGAPKKDLDYILGKAVHDNVAATLMKALTRKMAGSSGLREQFRQQAYQQYGEDASWLTRAAGSAAPFAVDVVTGGFALPSLAGKGAVKGVTNWMARNAAKTVSERAAGEVTKAAAKEMSTAALGRYLATNAPVMNVLVNSIGGAANFGTYEMQGEMIRQFGNDEFEPMQLLKAFGHGAALGGVMGVAGGSIGSLTKGAGVAGKVAGDVAGVAAETGIFAADNALEKAREDGVSILDVDWAEIAGESLGMVLGMKVVGGLMSPKSLRERYAKSPDYDLKLDERNRKELEGAGYNFSNIFKGMNEVADMIPLTLTKTKEFGASANKTRQIGEEEKVEVNSRVLDDLMKNPAISSDTKRKVFYLATGKILAPERVFHADMDIHEDGSATITTTNVAGDVISVKDYDDVRDADKVYQKRNAEAKANTLYGLDLLFKQFGIAERMESKAKYLTKEATGIDIDDVLPKKESERSGSEQAAVDAYIKNLQDSFIEWNNANKMRIAAEEAVRQGRDMQTPEEVHESERKMAAAGELLDEKTKRTLESMYEAGMNEENSAELTRIFEKYPDAREYFIGLGNRKGVDQQVNDKIAAAVAAERERMSQFIDADGSGYLIPVEYNGRKGYVVSGNDDEVIVKFEDNGDELPVLSGDEGLLYAEGEPNTLEDYMAQYEQRLTEQMRGEVESARMNHPLTKLEPVPGETIDTMDGKKRVAAVTDNGIFLEEPVMVLDEETGQMVPKHQKEFRPEDAVSLEEFVQKQNEYYDGMEQQERENTRMRQQAENYEPVEAVDYEQEGKADEMPVQGFDAGDVKPVSGETPADYEAAEGYEGGYDEGVTVDWREEQAKAERKKADDAIAKKKVAELGEPQSLREWIMRSLYNGGVKMIWGDSSENATKGLGSHTGLGRSNEEMRKRLWMLANRDKGGLYPEEAAERMLSSYASDMGWQGTEGDWPITSQDVLDELLDVVSAYGTKSSMGNAIKYLADNGEAAPKFSLADDIESVEPRIFSNILTKAVLLTANSNKDNLQKKADAIKRVVEQLEEKMQKLKEGQKVLPVAAGAVRSAATAQKEYDRGTVNNFVEFAKVVMDAGMMDDVTKGEVKRLLNLAKGVVSKEQIEKSLNAVADLIIDHSLRESKNLLKKQLSVKGSKVDSKGVEVQGKLDVEGQRVMSALKDGMKMDREALQNRLADVIDRMGSNNEVVANNASSEYEGLMLAKQYLEDIKASEMEESELKHEYQLAKDMLKEGEMDRESFKEFEESFRDNIRQMKMERIEAYQKLVLGIGGNIAKSFDAAKAFKEAEQERIKAIQHNANSDLEGTPATTQSELPWTSKLANAGLVRFFMQPVATFDEMLRFLGKKSVDGKGYLWNRYMTAWTKATDQLWKSTKEAHDELDEKVKEIFAEGTFIGKDGRAHKFPKIERWSDLFSLERKMEGADVEYWDDGKKTYHLSEGKLLYIYMVNKMKDGEMKLRKMGITEADVEAIKDHLNPSFIELADWIQSEFLPKRRVKYNEVYKRMFGADMAAIDNYFPLKIDKSALNKEEDISAYDGRADINPATITGSVIKRTRNASALDLMHTDAFDLVLSHLDDMERWAAFAEFNRDLNTLLSYKKFRNRLQNMTSGRFGAGKTLLENFKTVAAIAGGAYRPHVKADSVDSTMVNLAKGVTAAKISLRVYTAFKQLLSYPAYLSEANLMELAKSSNPVGAYKAWNWAMENLPLFAERWQSRQAGDYRLKETDMDWQVWKNDLVRTAARIGMSPNAFVDAMTVAMGANAVYETARKRYIKDGYDAEAANEKALLDASTAYNETQQSSQSAFMSAMQLDRTAASVALTVFRNASMAYERRMMRALHNMKNRLTNPDYKDESRAFMQKMMEREGVNEEQAKKASKRMYRRQMWRDIVDVAVFGYILQAAWNLAPYLPYLIAGDDDDERKKMLEDALRHAMFGGIEGLTGGSLMSEVGNLGLQIAAEDDDKKLQSLKQRARYQDFNLLPLMSDLQGVMNKSLSGDKSALVDGVNLLIQSGIGVNPQTFSDGVVASVDAFNGDLGAWKEFAFAMARIFQAPSSSMDMLYIDELGMFAHDARRLKMEDLAKRWARYKMMKENPLLRWAYTDDEEKELEEKLIKRFENKVKERVSDMDDKEVEKMLIQSQPGMEQQLLLKEMKSRYKKEAETLEGEALRKAFDEAELLDERKELAKDIAKEEGASRDPYGAKTEKYHEQQYQLLRTAADVREDAQLLKMQEDAEAAGNDARKKAISKMRSQVMEARKGLGAGDDEKVMETIRKSRRALIDELGKK